MCREMAPGPVHEQQFVPSKLPIRNIPFYGLGTNPGSLRGWHVITLVNIKQQPEPIHWPRTGILELHGIVEIEGPTVAIFWVNLDLEIPENQKITI